MTQPERAEGRLDSAEPKLANPQASWQLSLGSSSLEAIRNLKEPSIVDENIFPSAASLLGKDAQSNNHMSQTQHEPLRQGESAPGGKIHPSTLPSTVENPSRKVDPAEAPPKVDPHRKANPSEVAKPGTVPWILGLPMDTDIKLMKRLQEEAAIERMRKSIIQN